MPTTTGSAPSNDPGPQGTTQDTTGILAPVRSARLGTVGPVAWPGAYADVIGFTLWPKQYGARLGVHGIGDLLSTAFAPGASIAARVRQARADEPGQAPAAPAVQCGSVDLTADDWPIAEISSTIELNAAQRGALDQLKTAMSDAIASIKSTCRDDANLGPVERLRAMQNALWAVHDAAQLIRAPLAQFYATLTDDQKQKFAAPTQPQASARMSRADMARMCDLPASTDAPMRQIEQAIRPTKAQKASLDVLQKKALEMGQLLMASCLTPMPATPAERLDAAADRLTAVIFAAVQRQHGAQRLHQPAQRRAEDPAQFAGAVARLQYPAGARQLHPELDGLVVARGQVAIARQRPQREELRVAVVAQIEHARETGRGVARLLPESVAALMALQIFDAALRPPAR